MAPSRSRATSARPTRRRSRNSFKVVMEPIRSTKRKLHAYVTYDTQASEGYQLVPVGTPELTEHCKEYCRKYGRTVYIASQYPGYDAPEVSHHTQRFGYYFPSDVVAQACEWLGFQHQNGIFWKYISTGEESRLGKALAAYSDSDDLNKKKLSKEQKTKHIESSMRDLFPKMPSADMRAIVDRAFKKGSNRVGTCEEISLPRRVQLATIAHIRHKYTDYDNLLKQKDYTEARRLVQRGCIDKIFLWRGECDDEPEEIEELFREVIVLDDDNDDDDDDDEDDNTVGSEDSDRPPSLGLPQLDSDAGLGVQIKPVRPEDLQEEDSDDTGHLLARQIILDRTQDQLANAAKSQLRSAQRRLRDEDADEGATHYLWPGQVHVAVDSSGQLPHTIYQNGVLYTRAAPQDPSRPNRNLLHAHGEHRLNRGDANPLRYHQNRPVLSVECGGHTSYASSDVEHEHGEVATPRRVADRNLQGHVQYPQPEHPSHRFSFLPPLSPPLNSASSRGNVGLTALPRLGNVSQLEDLYRAAAMSPKQSPRHVTHRPTSMAFVRAGGIRRNRPDGYRGERHRSQRARSVADMYNRDAKGSDGPQSYPKRALSVPLAQTTHQEQRAQPSHSRVYGPGQ
ncbi:hypothetical protein LTR66_007621 [Elasticomyces elasticus]|nr:hypothetical protein LTR66_007621 [Elasticomyces elasticus]